MEFQQITNTSWTEILTVITTSGSDLRDPAYTLIEKAFSTLIPSWQLFLIAIASLYFFGLWRILNQYVKSLEGVLLAFVLYLALFHIVALSGLRQCITTGIAFLLIPLINDKKWKTAIPIIILGSTIHISLLFMLLLIPLISLPNNTKKVLYLISIVLIPAIAVSARSIVAYMASFLANDYYATYANAENEANPIIYVSLCSIISIYEYINYQKLIGNYKTSFIVPSNILMTLFVPLIFLDGTMIRIGQYFTLYLMVSLPLVFDQTIYRKIAYFTCILILALSIFTSRNEYHFFWENVPGFSY